MGKKTNQVVAAFSVDGADASRHEVDKIRAAVESFGDEGKKSAQKFVDAFEQNDKVFEQFTRSVEQGSPRMSRQWQQLALQQDRLKQSIIATFGAVDKAPAEVQAALAKVEARFEHATVTVRRNKDALAEMNTELGEGGEKWTGIGDAVNKALGPMGAAQAQMGLVTAAFREGWQMGMQFNSIMKTDMSEWEELTATMGARAKVAISEIADTFVALWRLQIEVMTPGAGYVDRVKQAYAELKGELKENITNLSDLAAAVARAEAAHKAAEEALKKNTDGTKANTDATKANTDATKANSDEAKANAEEKERAKKAADELAAAQDKLRKAQDALKDGTEQATKKEQELNEEKQKAIDQSRERIAGMREELDLLNEQITSGTTVVGSLGDQFDKWADLTGAIQREKFALEERQEVAFHGAESDAASAKLASDARMAHIEMVNQETRAIADAASKTTDLYKIVETTAGHYTNFTHEVRESTDRFRDWDEAASASTETARKAAEVIRELKDSADGAKRDIVAMGEELRRLNEEAGRTITTMRDLSAATTAAGEAAAKAAG